MKYKSFAKQSLQILISIDEQKLRLQRRGLDEPFSLKEAVQNEFGWLYESGIYLDRIYEPKRHPQRTNGKSG